MLIIKNNILPFGKNMSTINIFGILFTKTENISDKTINHEKIHSEQIFEMGVVGVAVAAIFVLLFGFPFWSLLCGASFFYIWYVMEFVYLLSIHKDWMLSYYNISLEKEAYDNENDFDYLNKRDFFAWFKMQKPIE